MMYMYVLRKFLLTNLLNLREEEIDGEAFVLMSVKDIVSMVKSKGAQLKLIKKNRQLSIIYSTVTSNICTVLNVS